MAPGPPSETSPVRLRVVDSSVSSRVDRDRSWPANAVVAAWAVLMSRLLHQ